MEQLILYSIPGFFFALSIIGISPGILNNPSQLATLGVITPFIGYALHQTYRLYIKMLGGDYRDSRKVIKVIKDELLTKEKISNKKDAAILIWEIGLRSSKDYKDFCDFDSRSFHYIQSFGSASFASIVGIIFIFVWPFILFIIQFYYLLITLFITQRLDLSEIQIASLGEYMTPIMIGIVLIQIILSFVFYKSWEIVYKKTNDLEVGFLRQHTKEFKKIWRINQKNLSEHKYTIFL